MTETRKLRIFLCHASQDKPIVRELYQRLNAAPQGGDKGWIDPWLDEEKLLPGQDWDLEIEKAVESSDAVIVCVSGKSVTKEGYVQKEIRKVLDIALEKPEETIFIIPLRLDDCELPRRLRSLHYVDYFPDEKRGQVYQRLLQSLNIRFRQLYPQQEDAQEIREEIKPPKISIYSHLVELALAKGSGTVDTVGTIPLILFFTLAALFGLTDSDSTIQLMVGVFAILAGIFLVIRKQMPSIILFKVSTILFLAIHIFNYTIEIPYGETLAGIVALIACGSAIVTVRLPKKPVFYSSVSMAVFLFILGTKEIVNVIGPYPDFFYPLLVIASVITIVLMIIDL
jgi:hypothetical protein